MELKNSILEKLQVITSELIAGTDISLDSVKIGLERPQDSTHGDWSTNLAMQLASRLKRSPRQVAEEIVSKFDLNIDSTLYKVGLSSVDVAGPGFINFKFANEYFVNQLASEKSLLEQIKTTTPQRIMVEFGHPNTHKLPHIGHFYSYVAGNSIAALLEARGHDLFRVNYQGDIGPHVAKCIYGWQEKGRQIPDTLIEKVRHLQECYQFGATAYEEDPEAKEKITEINREIYKDDSAIKADWELTRQWSLDYYLQFEKRIGVDQKIHYLESALWKKGMKIVRSKIGEVFEESDGAVIFPGEKYGLHNRVFITRYNTATYECKEVGLNQQKMQDWAYDLTIIPTASEQNGYFDVVIEAISRAIPELKDKIEHIGFGMVSLSTGKMSSRSGKILSAPDLLEAIENRVAEVVANREGLNDAEKQEIVSKVSQAAVKYSFLKGNILQNMSFDLEESISFEGNSGPYLQYTYARIKSVLRQSPESKGSDLSAVELLKLLTQDSELALIKWLERFAETVVNAADSRSPHLISTYNFELSQYFNSFYRSHHINTAESADLIAARRYLAEKVANTLRTGLNLLGIEVVEKM